MEDNKKSFWVIKDNKPQFLEGIIVEDDSGWYPHDVFREVNGDDYSYWFNASEDAIKNQIKSIEDEIWCETDILERSRQDFENWLKEKELERQTFIEMLKHE